MAKSPKKIPKNIKAVALETGHNGTKIIEPGEIFMVAALDGEWFKEYKGSLPVGSIDTSVLAVEDEEDDDAA